MADITDDRKNILVKIIDVYTPFLKRLITRLLKKGDPNMRSTIDRLKYVLNIFRDGDTKEKLEVHEACKDMLEMWYKQFKDVKTKTEDGSSKSENETDSLILAGPSRLDDSNFDFSSSSSSTDEKTKNSIGGIRIEDAIEIETNSTDAILPLVGLDNPVINIKKEKVDEPSAKVNSTVSKPPISNSVAVAKPVVPVQEKPPTPEENIPKEITFICASCQFRTTNEVDFMKHARTDHRTDLSLWCKNCGKCFSNAGVLVSHIKEANCTKEEMIYRCGVKDCTFETPSGQTFVHHLRHCHKGSPFIFCVHCQKIFTLPHCLILHMQNDCPFKDRNRKNPGDAKATENAKPATPVSTPRSNVVTSTSAKPSGVSKELPVTNATTRTVTLETVALATVSPPMPSPRNVPTPRGRGRGSLRGRWARSSKFSDSSDSDDPDDPSWRPEETSSSQPLRRSARWASRVSDAKNPDLEEDTSVAKKSKSFIEQPASRIVHCPCCDFSAAFESLLRDHYVASHKQEKRNACLVCSVKFESVDLFIKHFSLHEKDQNSLEKKDVSESSNDSLKNESMVVEEVVKAPEKTPAESSSSEYFKDIQVECVPGKFSTAHDRNVTQIPYQTAIHEKISKDSKIKSFEDLKSTADIAKMRSETKLKHFFKCTVYGCTFTTDDDEFYTDHLNEKHGDKKVHCTYCFQEFLEAQPLVEHMFRKHSKRCYQCSVCFYRAFSKAHIQIHIRNAHKSEKAHVYSCSLHLRPNYSFPEEDINIVTTYPFVCAVGDCKFQSFDPKEFSKHTDMSHRSVSQLYCYYCKGDFISLKRLLSHYHLHGINNFQCNYCIHGSENKDEILLHLCNSHADKAFKVYVRDSQEAEFTNKSCDVSGKAPVSRILPKAAIIQQNGSNPNQLSIQTNCASYPKEVHHLDESLFCRMISCKKECKNFSAYLNHLQEEHCAINILCPYCSVVCSDSSNFENHMMCHGPNLYACSAEGCQLGSFKKSDVEKHMETVHKLQSNIKIIRENLDQKITPLKINSNAFPMSKNKTQFYICPFCYYKNSDCKLMKNHIYAEFMYARFQCNLCKGKMCSRSETRDHFTKQHTHHNVKCEVNNNPEIEFLTKIFLSLDVQTKFLEYLRCNSVENDVLSFASEYKCEQCDMGFKDIADWQYHWNNCISNANKLYVCNYCTEKFGDVAHLKHHTIKDHAGQSVSYTNTENALQKQMTLRVLQLGKLKFVKALLDPYLKNRNLYGDKLKAFQFESKYYKCGYCNFNDTFRSNIKKHNMGCHKDKILLVEKVKNSVDIPENYNNKIKAKLNANTDQILKVEKMPENKSFICSFCDSKVQKLEELEQHVRNAHAAVIKDSYPFYYLPDLKWEYKEDDTELYNCAYCSVSQENLYHLKRHCNNLHLGVPFKVRGMHSNNTPTIQCTHCDVKVVSQELLEKHCSLHHPKLPLKVPKKEEKRVKRKCDDEIAGPSTKVLKKTNTNEYQCGYCDESFLFYIQMITHHEAEHSNTSLKFSKASGSENADGQSISCDFCSYLANQELMNTHLSTKHKNCFVCGYCGKAFSAASDIVNHAKTGHKDLPIQVIKVNDFSLSKSSKDDDLGFSYYGRKPEPIDFHNITINLTSGVSSTNAQLPVIYLSQMFPMFPVVQIEDFAKPSMNQ